MKAGITLRLHVAGLPAEVSGIYTEESGIILDGSLRLASAGNLRDALEFLLEKCGHRLSLSFLPQVQADAVWMTYRQKQAETGFGVRFRDGKGELGLIQAVMGKSGSGENRDYLRNEGKEVTFRFAFLRELALSEIPVAGDWMGKGGLGPVEFVLFPDGGTELNLTYSFGEEKGRVRLSFPEENGKQRLLIPEENGRKNLAFPEGKERLNPAFSEGMAGPSSVRWKPFKKKFGCVTLLAVGGTLSEGCLYVMLQAQLHLSVLTITLEGLGVRIPFGNLCDTRPVLTGLGLGVQAGRVGISGLFAKELNRPSYSGQLIIQVRTLGFTLMGAYEQASFVSVFAAGLLNLNLAGTGCVKIRKIAAGFGYNRRLFVPQIDKLGDFTLMKVMRGEISPGQAAGEMPAAQGRHWLAAGIEFESYGILRGDAAASVIFGDTLRTDLTGKAVLDLKLLVHIVLLIQASFQPEAGLICVSAAVGGESYLLARDCRVTGGFAFYVWYDGEHKGDFVLTMGGYHREYNKPAHYPSVPQLGLRWQITRELLLQGNLYFALTPSGLMAGGSMQMLFDGGCVQAWCTAKVDILLMWNPFSYDFNMEVSLGIRVKIGFIKAKLEIGCGLHLWGPEFSGIARIKLWIISFDISFIKNAADDKKKIDWKTFKENYLKQNVNGAGSFCGCGVQIYGGLLREEGKPPVSQVSAGEFKAAVSSAVPFTGYRLNGGDRRTPECCPSLGIYPCGEEKMEALLVIEVTFFSQSSPGERSYADLGAFSVREEVSQVPCALWGNSCYKNARGKWEKETIPAAAGISLEVKNEDYPELAVALSRETKAPGAGEGIFVPAIKGREYPQSEIYARMSEIRSRAVCGRREKLLKELGFEEEISFKDGWSSKERLEELFREPPAIETLGA